MIRMTLSNTTNPDRAEKAKIRPVLLRDGLYFQETLYRGLQVFHGNYTAQEMRKRLAEHMNGLFRQAQIVCAEWEATVLVSKKGKVTVKRREKAAAPPGRPEASALAHDRPRQYLLREGEPVDFLVELGVQTADGRVVKRRYDKFRQINRYLEMIDDVWDRLPAEGTLHIVDFGCGKSYLTFAMYYYLHTLRGRSLRVTGLDLKADVIRRCSDLAQKLGYEGLSFQQGDIRGYRHTAPVDMVVSLHACDKATDYCLAKAVEWGAAVILAVPCCQHELNGQLTCDILQPILKYGVIKERMAALITDALRAGLLEQQGYDTQILEFIDLEHTPKNLMIRAVRRRGMSPKKTGLEPVMEFLHVNPALKELL